MSPTARSMELLRERGFTVQVVETFNRFSKRRVDLFGCIDIVAVHPDKIGVWGIQATTGDHHTHRVTKALAEPRLGVWLEAGNRFVVMSWSRRGRGKRAKWTVREEFISLGQVHMALERPESELMK